MKNKLTFHHVAIKFHDIDSAVDFFLKFGFEIISHFKTRKGKTIICLEKDNFIIEACQSNSLPEEKGQLKHLAFKVDDIKRAVKELKKNGLRFVEEVTKSQDENGKTFYFAYFLGPENLKLELHQEEDEN